MNKNILLLIFTFCIVTLGNAQDRLEENEKVFLQKAKPDLITAFKNGQNEFWIVLDEQTDVSGSKQLATKEEKGQYVFDKLTETASRSQAIFIPLLKSKAVSYQQFWIVNAIYVSGDINLAREIAAFKEVKELLPNPTLYVEHPAEAKKDATSVAGIEWGIAKVKAPSVWALGYKGQGVVVGGEDTGYQFDHPALKTQYRGFTGTTTNHNYNWHDAIHAGTGSTCGINSPYPCDDYGHGTHTMGTMVGDDKAGNQIGMAPLAKWIGCRNMNAGAGTPVTYIECFQWFLAPTDLTNQNPMPAKAPHVINNSWGCDAPEGCNTSNFSTMEIAVKNLRAAGVVVVVSAGNTGSTGCNSIITPAAIFDASFTVGATTETDNIAGFSSRGNVSIDNSNRIKPDVSAPGTNIRSSYPGSAFSIMQGTSMAGPHVAGAVALLISAAPWLAGNVDSIERILEKTAVHISSTQTCNGTSPTTFPNNTVGYGRIDILAAVNYALSVVSTPTYNQPGRGITVFPMPAKDKLFARFENSKEGQAEITLFNTTGQSVFEKTITIQNKSIEISVSTLSKGFYMYSIKTADTAYYGKFIKE